MSLRDRARRPARGVEQRPVRPRVLIVCEGRLTEPVYFEALARSVRNPRVEVKVEAGKGVPVTVVEFAIKAMKAANKRAKEEKDDNLAYEEVWCVIDVDEHPNLGAAQALAGAHGIQMAVSNPCFELWLLLHLREQPGPQHRHDVQRLLGERLSGYGKDVTPFLTVLLPGVSVARQRALRLAREAAAVGEAGRNPSTGVHGLVDVIEGGGR